MGCHNDNSRLQPIDEDEYKIYGLLVDSVYNDEKREFYFVNDSTLCNDPVPYKEHTWRELPPGLYTPNDLRRVSKNWQGFNITEFEQALAQTNEFRQRIIIDSIRTLAVLKKRDWSTIDSSRYAESYARGDIGLLWFSRPVFNSMKDECLVYSDFGCGFKCGYGCWFWLKRIDSKWKIQNKHQTWES